MKIVLLISFLFGPTHGFNGFNINHLLPPHAVTNVKRATDASVNSIKTAGISATLALSLLLPLSPPSQSSFLGGLLNPPAEALESKVIGQISGSGLIFKDTLNIERFQDPKIPEVTLFISNFERPITERVQKDFFSDPSFASVGCAKMKAGKVNVGDSVAKGAGGEEVFEESRSLLFKTLRVQRVYDPETNTVVYVSFNTRLDKSKDANKSRFKSSICAVNLND